MPLRPTLGGLKKAQEFLSLPVFQMDIYKGGKFTGFLWEPGKGKTIPIDEAIKRWGADKEVIDVRLTDEQGDKFVEFANVLWQGMMVIAFSLYAGTDCVMHTHGLSVERDELLNVARWGKSKQSLFEEIIYDFFPGWYFKMLLK